MKALTETNYRSLFKASVILKGIIAVGELIAGFLFLFLTYDALFGLASGITGDELTEHPTDLLWSFVVRGLHGFTSTPREVWAFIFLSHGIVKLALIAGLLANKRWAYPWSAAVFSGFLIYQIWQMTATFSLALLLVTILDAIVVALVLHEYRWRKRHHHWDATSAPATS